MKRAVAEKLLSNPPKSPSVAKAAVVINQDNIVDFQPTSVSVTSDLSGPSAEQDRQAGPLHANYKRSLVKTVTWRIIGSVDTFIIGYFATGEMKIGLAIAGTEVITKMVLYYFHERGWSRVKWGLVKT